mmetsp:Transcript_4375/g.11178  ORF Transcript_4375/g.11178 Transcript_4375/m.11178 type:complete len:337 (+) Transcript_4375:124-1134(+)
MAAMSLTAMARTRRRGARRGARRRAGEMKPSERGLRRAGSGRRLASAPSTGTRQSGSGASCCSSRSWTRTSSDSSSVRPRTRTLRSSSPPRARWNPSSSAYAIRSSTHLPGRIRSATRCRRCRRCWGLRCAVALIAKRVAASHTKHRSVCVCGGEKWTRSLGGSEALAQKQSTPEDSLAASTVRGKTRASNSSAAAIATPGRAPTTTCCTSRCGPAGVCVLPPSSSPLKGWSPPTSRTSCSRRQTRGRAAPGVQSDSRARGVWFSRSRSGARNCLNSRPLGTRSVAASRKLREALGAGGCGWVWGRSLGSAESARTILARAQTHLAPACARAGKVP